MKYLKSFLILSAGYTFASLAGCSSVSRSDKDDHFSLSYRYTAETAYFGAELRNGKLYYSHLDEEAIRKRCATWIQSSPCWTPGDILRDSVTLSAAEWDSTIAFVRASGITSLDTFYGPAPGERCYPYTLNIQLEDYRRKIIYCSSPIGPSEPEAFTKVSGMVAHLVEKKFNK